MAPTTYDMVMNSSLPAEKLFKAFCLDADNLVPKVMPEAIKSVEILEGDGGVGTIKLITFGEGSQYKCVKHRVDAIDEVNMTYSYSIIEGDALGDELESISYHIKIEASADGGSICKNRSIYHLKGAVHLAEEKIKEGKDRAKAMFHAIEAHLHANPHCCN